MTATLELMAAADARGVSVFVHTSSSGTIGRRADGGPGDEETPASEHDLRNLYFRSKVEGDAKIRRYSSENGMRVVQILPGWIWGPGDLGPTGAGQIILDFLDGKFPAVPDGGSSVVDAPDVANAMIRAVEQPHGERFICTRERSLGIADGWARCGQRRRRAHPGGKARSRFSQSANSA